MTSLLINKPLIIAMSLPFLGGIGGAFITKNAVDGWYKSIKKPSWTPPNWVFGPVWTSLYLIMGYSSYMVYSHLDKFPVQGKRALMIYAGHLILNFIWTPVFFGWKKLGLSCFNILGLDAALVWTMVEFHKIHPMAAYLNIPYLLWASYASSVNIGTWWLNRNNRDHSKVKKDKNN